MKVWLTKDRQYKGDVGGSKSDSEEGNAQD